MSVLHFPLSFLSRELYVLHVLSDAGNDVCDGPLPYACDFCVSANVGEFEVHRLRALILVRNVDDPEPCHSWKASKWIQVLRWTHDAKSEWQEEEALRVYHRHHQYTHLEISN